MNRVVAENKEKISADYKILKHINCKGERPNKMLVKTKKTQENELLKNMDMSKSGSKLQKEVEGMIKDQKQKEDHENKVKMEKQDANTESQAAIEDEIDEGSGDEKPEGIVQPKFKVVHSYPVDIGDTWQGHRDASEGADLQKMHKLPSEVTVTIYVKYIDSLKAATLDINDSTLMFKYPDVYYLDINLCYKVDKLNGTAKFDKSKKTLTVRVPVVGSTDDSQKVLEQHFRDFKEKQELAAKNLKNLQTTNVDDEMETRRLRKKNKGASTAADLEEDAQQADNQENQSTNQIADLVSQYSEAGQGVSKPRVLMGGETDKIDDKYDFAPEVDKSQTKEDKRDVSTIKREDFLSIVKDSNGSAKESQEVDGPNIDRDGVQFK